MAYNIKQTAQRLQELREICGYSVEQVAEKLGITCDEYEKIESGNAEASVGLLYEAARLYNVELTEILTGDAPRLKVCSVVRKGEGLKVDRGININTKVWRITSRARRQSRFWSPLSRRRTTPKCF